MPGAGQRCQGDTSANMGTTMSGSQCPQFSVHSAGLTYVDHQASWYPPAGGEGVFQMFLVQELIATVSKESFENRTLFKDWICNGGDISIPNFS